ncbi:SDR family NAD(P)-dependent oxidoreductase [Amycolatopsis sp. A133]|uniref:SDR family NAD(P)-dependent oxidoreductase n=1 Tax=Amycolatopsis sp. A133 TaxID=3064472 RepID=UPI0027E9908F|nr:SDR family NAD(P)-dependent oxidoreductase [Amycolatopsis sp. A133]MDQ7803517.1 SDR family NAD(P)-dependent oxidoreductase [Amycolatopsis sp. A133]
MATNRRVLVTGANRGLGAAIADLLRERGHDVVPGVRDPAVAAEIGGVHLDVTDAAGVAEAARAVGPIDVLVNNAGILVPSPQSPSAVPIDLVRAHLEVNALGAWRVSQAFTPGMVRRGWGRIVMVSSGTGAFGNGLQHGLSAYAVSKVALNALTVMLAAELEGTGVLVNAVNPGLVRTRMRPDAQRTAREAAADVVWAATLEDDGPTGGFFRGERRIDW